MIDASNIKKRDFGRKTASTILRGATVRQLGVVRAQRYGKKEKEPGETPTYLIRGSGFGRRIVFVGETLRAKRKRSFKKKKRQRNSTVAGKIFVAAYFRRDKGEGKTRPREAALHKRGGKNGRNIGVHTIQRQNEDRGNPELSKGEKLKNETEAHGKVKTSEEGEGKRHTREEEKRRKVFR